jgi:UDP-2,4-diacetamido-2,4,6-trideoxy-beta-L-altropyranose hydrolase
LVFRTDASLQIGTGHVMRCLTLADALREHGAHCRFICRDHPGNLFDLIGKRGYSVHVLPDVREHMIENEACSEPALGYRAWLGVDWDVDAQQTVAALDDTPVDWLIVDYYALDARWEQVLKAHCKKLLVIDDLADRPHVCDVLLDQNLGREATDYASLVPEHCIVLAGPRFALLRPEFAALREYSLQRRKMATIKHLLITMGGVDKDNATGQVLNALNNCNLPPDLRITVVMGPHAPWFAQVQAQAAQMPWPTKVLVGVDNMAQLMAESDLAIGAAGSTSWERCCLGLATIQIALAQNQVTIAQALSNVGAALMLQVEIIAQTLPGLIGSMTSADKLYTISAASSAVTQGKGAALVSDYIKEAKEVYENYPLMQ